MKTINNLSKSEIHSFLTNAPLIRQYNEECHFMDEDDREQMETIDESEIDEYLLWCANN
jgi:hypothetical protein